MAERPRHGCRAWPCPKLVPPGQLYCDDHQAKGRARHRDLDRVRGTASERGYDGRWQKRRARQLKLYPLCQECERHGRVTVATEVHHLVPKRYGGTDDPSNLWSVCDPCHGQLEAEATRRYGKT